MVKIDKDGNVTGSNISDYESFTADRAKKMIQEIQDPKARRDELRSLKQKITNSKYTWESWQGYALEVINNGIEGAILEIKDQQKQIGDKLTFEMKDTAIELTADSMDQKELCKSALTEYVQHKNKDSNRSDRDIYINEIDDDGQSNVKESTFYRWIKKYNNVLDAFNNAQEK